MQLAVDGEDRRAFDVGDGGSVDLVVERLVPAGGTELPCPRPVEFGHIGWGGAGKQRGHQLRPDVVPRQGLKVDIDAGRLLEVGRDVRCLRRGHQDRDRLAGIWLGVVGLGRNDPRRGRLRQQLREEVYACPCSPRSLVLFAWRWRSRRPSRQRVARRKAASIGQPRIMAAASRAPPIGGRRGGTGGLPIRSVTASRSMRLVNAPPA